MPDVSDRELGSSLSNGDSFQLLLESAQSGSGQAIGELLEGCRQYLTLIANREQQNKLRSKGGASDLVQDSFLEAQCCFHQFSGKNEADLLAWLKGILLHNLSDFSRRYERSQKRRVSREQRWDPSVDGSIEEQEGTTPSGWLMRQERLEALRAALDRMRDDDRCVLILRYRDGLTFPQIAQQMQRSPDAARMLWTRALKRMTEELESFDG